MTLNVCHSETNKNVMDCPSEIKSCEEGVWCVRKSYSFDKKLSKKGEEVMDAEVHLPVHEQCVVENVDKTQREKCMSCCKKFTTFLFSTVGLCCLVIGYSILGGFIFKELESPYEKRLKSDVVAKRQYHVQKLWNITEEFNVLFKENWTIDAEKIMIEYANEIVEATKRNGWDGKDGETELQWSFAGALLYSVTVITTIGYGHIAPRTVWGRVVTIIYAVLGIPLTLLFLANMGSLMANSFRFLYNNVFCGICCMCFKRKKRNTSMRAASTRGKSVREYKGEERNGDPSTQRLTTENGRESLPASENVPRFRVFVRSMNQKIFKKDQDISKLSVPLTVCVLLIAGYIFAGALLFTLWEREWDLLVGSYFCFITLTTIGFGDYVPGTSSDSWANQQKLVLCALYLVFGLSLLAMCFELMQEEVKNKCKSFGKWIGILQK